MNKKLGNLSTLATATLLAGSLSMTTPSVSEAAQIAAVRDLGAAAQVRVELLEQAQAETNTYGGSKDGEGKCGEGKCGEGKCGEGTCGDEHGDGHDDGHEDHGHDDHGH